MLRRSPYLKHSYEVNQQGCDATRPQNIESNSSNKRGYSCLLIVGNELLRHAYLLTSR